MSSQQHGNSGGGPEPDFAQAFKDLAKGEQAAAALEKHLESVEKKIEELLAKADEDERRASEAVQSRQSGDQPAVNDNDDAA